MVREAAGGDLVGATSTKRTSTDPGLLFCGEGATFQWCPGDG